MVSFVIFYFQVLLDNVKTLSLLSLIPMVIFSCSPAVTSPSGQNTEPKSTIKAGGSIYGRVFDVTNDHNPDNKLRKIKLYGSSGLFEVLDSIGLYHFNNIPPGNYNLVVESFGKQRKIDSISNIVVGKDSISFIQTTLYNEGNFISQWDGNKLHKKNMANTGKIKGIFSIDKFKEQTAGYRFNPKKELPIVYFSNKNLDYYSPENVDSLTYMVATDSLGNFEIDNVKPGLYAGYTSVGNAYFSLIIGILVLSDSTAIVELNRFLPKKTILENYLISKPFSRWNNKYN